MNENVEQVKQEKQEKPVAKKKMKLPKDLKSIKSLVTSKVALIVVAVIVALFIITFPHTKTSKVNAELTGVFAVQKERYVLHRRTSFTTEFTCVPTAVVKSQSIHYKLNGDIKSISTENCDGSSGFTKYNSNGTIKSTETTAFVGGNLSVTVTENNSLGQLETRTVRNGGTVTTTVNEYHPNNVLKSNVVTIETFGEKTGETIKTFDDKSKQLTETFQNWTNGELVVDVDVEFTDGDVSAITYVDEDDDVEAEITCTATKCTLDKLTGSFYTVTYNTASDDYDLLVSGEAASVKVFFVPITENNIPGVIASIEADAQAIKDAQ